MAVTKQTPEERRLALRRERLENLLAMGAPDIIVWHEMQLVAKSQRKVHGRGWTRPATFAWLGRVVGR